MASIVLCQHVRREEKALRPQECNERISLGEKYSLCITAYVDLRNTLKSASGERREEDWRDVEAAWAESEKAWRALEQHIAEHHCLDLGWQSPDAPHAGAGAILGKAAAAAIDVILVADDDRCFVDVNEAAAEILGLPRNEIAGRRIDDFFSEARGEPIPSSWKSFLSEGVQSGICELKAPGGPRRFEYRAKANFAAGLHLSVLRELT
jgi:PAS domain-containing protein